MFLNPLIAKDKKALQKKSKPKQNGAGEYLDLRGTALTPFKGVNLAQMDHLAKLVRGLIFATVENAQSGHPGGSSSKVEQFLALTLGGTLAFDPADPKHPGRDRVIWSAGHCTPLLYGGQALLYEALRRTGRQFSEAVVNCVLPEQLLSFRRMNGLSGHAESIYPFCDYCTGPSGHGFSAAGGLAISHHASGLPTKVWVMMGDAESEEGMTYEARNVVAASGAENLIVSLDYNHFGIDGPVEEAMSAPYLNYWLGFDWNVVEVDGHNVNELLYAYALAGKGFGNAKPTVVIAHTLKGKDYGKLENSCASHGSPTSHEEYVKLMQTLGFEVSNEKGFGGVDIEIILDHLTDEDGEYIESRFTASAKNIEPESELVARIKEKISAQGGSASGGKKYPLINPREIKRPAKLPAELIFKSGERVSLRHASELWFEWLMKQTAFFYAGAGDLSKSVLTGSAEKVYGIINEKNPFGRGIRFGIAESNMAMMSMAMTQDILPGGFRPISVFGTYGVFAPLYGEQMHLALINNFVNPKASGFFVALATHDGPETGEDGPTHQGMFWSSLFKAYPGVKVYKPADANEVIEILFSALEIGEPIVLALPRGDAKVLARDENNLAAASANGAYVYKNYSGNGKQKRAVVASGAVVVENLIFALPEIEKQLDVKIIIATSPQKYFELMKSNPSEADKIISNEEKKTAITLHNGWVGWLDEFLMTPEVLNHRIGVERFLSSGKAGEVVDMAGLDVKSIAEKILRMN
ncbi:MAG: 1-deoxy-D-xylulose-5-phosphate synthase N-terminal domain-containing protein [Patescibacteria group bacterium]